MSDISLYLAVRASLARGRRRDEIGEVMPWLLLTLGLLALVAIVVVAIDGWTATKDGDLNNY